MPRARGEDGGVAAVGRPLDVAAQVARRRLGAHAAQCRRLRLGPHERTHGMAAMQQQGHDAAAEPPARSCDQDDHATSVPFMKEWMLQW